MRISDLIAKLQDILEQEGNAEVVFYNPELHCIEELLDTESCFSMELGSDEEYNNDHHPEGKFLCLQGGGLYGAVD